MPDLLNMNLINSLGQLYLLQYGDDDRWWWPFWTQHGFTNTHRTIESAENYIRSYVVQEVIKEVDL